MASDPVPLHTLTWGDGGRRVLLLHGITASAAGWWRVGNALAEAGWCVVAPDLRGHGASPKAGSYRFSDQVKDVVALGNRWDAVLGHSMGGAIAVLAATATQGWTESLILQDPALMMPESIDEVMSWLLDDFTRPLTPERLHAESPRWHRRDAEEKAAALHAVGPEVVEQIIRENWPWMTLAEAAAITVPALVLGSDPETGGLLPVAIGRWLAASNPLIEFSVLPGSSHSAHRDTDLWDSYLSTLVDALTRLPTLRR